MRSRFIAFFLAVIVGFGCVASQPKQAYANPAVLTPVAVDAMYALLGSMGIIVASGAIDIDKRQVVQSFYESLDIGGKTAFNAVMVGFVLKDTDVLEYVGESLSDSWRDFYESCEAYLSARVGFDLPLDGYQQYYVNDITGNITNQNIGASADIPFFYRSTGGGVGYDFVQYVFALLPSGHLLRYSYRNGKLDSSNVFACGKSASMILSIDFGHTYSGTFVNRLIDSLPGAPSVAGNCSWDSVTPGSRTGIAWGNANERFYYGKPDLTGLAYFNGVATAGTLVPADTWLKTWEDAVASDKQVGINTGKDLGVSDTVDGVYNDLLVGVIPGTVNPPIDPPIEGGGNLDGIMGLLRGILDKIKALPALIATAIVGSGTLNFDKFKNIKVASVFPFCVPFDLINSFVIFNAPPVAPVWTIEFSKTPMVGMPDLVLDLRGYDYLFAITRFFVYVSFVIGLIVLTRNIIKG